MSTRPSGINFDACEPVRLALFTAHSQLASWMNLLPPNTIQSAATGSAFLSFAGTQTTNFLSEQIVNGNKEIVAWAGQSTRELEALQTDQFTQDFISSKLKTLYAGSELEFEASVAVYLQVRAGIGLPSAAGIQLRNVLETMNGNLKELARSYSGNPALKKWPDVALAIARGGPASAEAALLVAQESVYNDLHGHKLTPIAKNDFAPTSSEWDAIYLKYITFLYTTLGLIDFKSTP